MARPQDVENSGGAADQKVMRFLVHVVFRGVVCYGVALALLRWIYPWQIHYGSFNVTWTQALKPYLALAVLMTGIAGAAGYAAAHFARTASPLMMISIITLTTYILLTLVSVLLGPLGVDIPALEIRTTMFTEYKFLTFIFAVAPPYSVSAALAIRLWR